MLLSLLRKMDLPKADDLDAKTSYQLTLLLLLVSLPLLFVFPLGVAGGLCFCVALKWLSIARHFHVSRWLIALLLVVAIALLLKNFFVFGKEYAAVALLLVLASLKLLEAKVRRDAFLLMLIYCLLIMGGLMTNQSPLLFCYLFICLIFNLFIQIRLSQSEHIVISWWQQLKSMVKIALLAMPFVVVLFFFFPRIEPLWKQPSPPSSQTGLSDEMSPDGLSELALNGSLAFRVTFNKQLVPSSRYLYWRGPVLVNFDGKTWRRLAGNSDKNQAKLQAKLSVTEDSRLNYTIYQIGATDKWILPLDMPNSVPKNTQLNIGYEMQSTDPINKVTAFDVTSYTQYQLTGLSGFARERYTLLPPDIYPKTRQLAAKLRQSSASDEDFIRRVLAYFNENSYYYDLAPSPGNDDIDTFLLSNKSGYCQHYASAFAFMLRAVNIPSRVIIGYQGGEINQVSKEWEVKQLNAHAWVEAYLADKGWVRYDPTAAVALERINSGSPLGVARNSDLIDFTSRLESSSKSYRWLSESLRALSSFWQNWIINYNRDKQQSLWQRLGLAAMSSMLWFILLFVLLVLTIGFVFIYRQYRQRQSNDSVWHTMQPFMRQLYRLGLDCPGSVPLGAFIRSEFSCRVLGEAQPDAEHVINLYYQLRYSPQQTTCLELKKAIAEFRKTAKNISLSA